MRAWLTFFAVVLIVIGALLFYAALLGNNYYAMAVQVEMGLAILFFAIAAIVAWLAYGNFQVQYTK